MIWFLEGQASQRDIILGARDALPPGTAIHASHRGDRAEITGLADISYQEPADPAERLAFILDTALAHGIRVIVAGRAGAGYEVHREVFQRVGLVLVTGGTSLETFERVDDKSQFTAQAQRAGLACVPAITVTNADELVQAHAVVSAQGEACIKPAVGIYGQGFWRFRPGVDRFRCFANPDAREVSFSDYLQAYTAQATRPAMLVMPYLAGSECSMDMVCEAGRVVACVGRRKQGGYQTFERDGAAVELAVRAAEHFGCDGLVNVQTRDDAQGVPHLLEINPRYSGGIGYTRATGVNLAGIFATRRLGYPEPPRQWVPGVRVRAITVAAIVSD